MNTSAVAGVRLALGGLLVWAGVAKLAAPAEFFGALLGYELPLPETLLRLVAVTLPWLEVICGIAFLVNWWPETVRPLVLLLTLGFVVVLSQALARGLDVACGCFGGSEGGFWSHPAVAWVRAVLLLAGSLFLVRARLKWRC